MLHCLDAEEGREVRDFFRDSGYTAQTLQKRFGAPELQQYHRLKLLSLGIPLEPSRLNLLLRWFHIAGAVDAAAAAEFIPERMLGLFLKAGVLVLEDGGLQSTVRISPFAQFLIVSDHALSETDTIPWPNPTTLLSYYMSTRAPVARTLDLGTGNGVLALAAAAHSGSVVATDLNSRAGEFCLFNAALNGVNNVEFRQGNAFQPVCGERFDLILSNPPFFVTPSVRRIFSDNDMELDGFCRTLVRQAPEYLTENGYYQMLAEWVQIAGQPWRDRLTEWFEGSGCDAWVLAEYTRSAVDYAMVRVHDDNHDLPDPAAQAALIRQWQTYFESRRVEAIYGGIIVLRKREGRNRVLMEEMNTLPTRPFGEFMRRTFENRDALERYASDEQLLATRPLLPASARLLKQFAISAEGWKLTSVDLRLSEGLPYSLALQPQVADFIALFDGNRTLGETADHFAGTLGIDPALVRREGCAITRHLADRGMVSL